jgi:S1-C subfamily serine protease
LKRSALADARKAAEGRRGGRATSRDGAPPTVNTGLVIGLAAGAFVLVLLVGGSILAYFLFLHDKGGQPAQENQPLARQGFQQLENAGNPAAALPLEVPGGAGNPAVGPDNAADGGSTTIPLKTLTAIKNATVFIKIEAGRLAASGSGFLMRVEGDSALVVTNHHVVTPPSIVLGPGRLRPRIVQGGNPTITVVFRSGTQQEQAARADIVLADKDKDLAILRVAGIRDLPAPIDFSQRPKLVETMAVFIFGFPFGEALALNKGNPAVTVGKGSVSSLRLDEKGEVAGVQIDGALNPGNSGGPVVDAQGHLVGVSVAAIKGAGIGLAIPPLKLTQLLGRLNSALSGRLASATLTRRRGDGDSTETQGEAWEFDEQNQVQGSRSFAQRVSGIGRPAAGGGNGKRVLEVQARLTDPGHKMQSVSVYYVRTPDLRAQPVKDAAGMWQLLPGVQKVDLLIEGEKATATLNLPAADARDDLLTIQFCYVSGEGKPRFTQPRAFSMKWIDIPPPVVKNPDPRGRNKAPGPDSAREEARPLGAAELAQLLDDLDSPNGFKRQHAAERLAKAKPSEPRDKVVKALEPLIKDSSPFLRRAAIQALGVWGNKETVPGLLKVLTSDDVFTRQAAIEALADLKDERAAEPLAKLVANFQDRGHAARALQAIGSKAEKAVLPLLQHSDLFVRVEACKILEVIGTKEAIPALKIAAGDSNGLLRQAAENALKAIQKT